ncbi:MAG: hypothetical protein RI560_08895 [Natronomonas sp.]|nr:hypothetical protein [Natronomonas sp.]
MAKSQVSLTVPNNIDEKIDRYQDEHGLEYKSEATRQLIEAGVQARTESGPGERLIESAVSIAVAASVIAVAASAFGVTWAWGLVLPSLTATFVFAMLLASIRVMAGKELV